MATSQLAIKTGKSIPVRACQTCNNKKLHSVIFLGYLPPVNKLQKIGSIPQEQPSYPAELLYCDTCYLAQLGLIVDPTILFPPEYPYTSGTTKVLRDNFSELYQESSKLLHLKMDDLIVDIGSNDGTLLLNFQGKHRILGITPEEVGRAAIKRGVPTIIDYFTSEVASKVIKKHGRARMITAANVFAHMEDIHGIIAAIKKLLAPDGVFISESHYLLPLLQSVQYDTIYHEHMRYYSLSSLINLLSRHGLEVFHAKEIPSHGGSIRVYASKKGTHSIRPSVKKQLHKEQPFVTKKASFISFANKTMLSKLSLHAHLLKIKKNNQRIYGISAPSRASTMINYTGLDESIIDYVLEIKGSHKIGNYIPGTKIPIIDEEKLFSDQPEYALLFSWHIAEELMPKLTKNGFKGDYIIPLPTPRIVSGKKFR